METLHINGTTYTVNHSERGFRKDRTVYELTGPKGAKYAYAEFDSGYRTLTACSRNARTIEWHAPPMPRPENDPLYGISPTVAHLDEQIGALVEAVDGWVNRDREDTSATYIAAGRVLFIARNISADLANLASLEHRINNRALV